MSNWKSEYKLKTLRPSPMISWDSTLFREKEARDRKLRDIKTALIISLMITALFTLIKMRTTL